jgi:hypothetical protein
LIEFARRDLSQDIQIDGDQNGEDKDDDELAERFQSNPLAYVWRWFNDLTDWRQQSVSVGPLSHLEIECWARLYRLDPPIRPFEVDLLRRLDRICRHFYTSKNDEPQETDRGIGEQIRAIADDPNKEGYPDG